jgi:hypothetical protein
MKWSDLSPATKNVLERCWGLHSDEPRSFTVTIGETLYGHEVTMDTYKEIVQYQQHFPYFNVKLKGQQIRVQGTCTYGSWLTKNEV